MINAECSGNARHEVWPLIYQDDIVMGAEMCLVNQFFQNINALYKF